ncbi:hypothetical protein, partial [Escherichia coli]
QESRLPPGSDFRRWVWITIAPFVTSEHDIHFQLATLRALRLWFDLSPPMSIVLTLQGYVPEILAGHPVSIQTVEQWQFPD